MLQETEPGLRYENVKEVHKYSKRLILLTTTRIQDNFDIDVDETEESFHLVICFRKSSKESYNSHRSTHIESPSSEGNDNSSFFFSRDRRIQEDSDIDVDKTKETFTSSSILKNLLKNHITTIEVHIE